MLKFKTGEEISNLPEDKEAEGNEEQNPENIDEENNNEA